MTETQDDLVTPHFERHQRVVAQSLKDLREPIRQTGKLLVEILSAGKKAILFGNGGSATQASHLAGELLGRYRGNRRPLPGIALVGDPGVITCIGNDFGYGSIFARQVEALAQPGDAAVGFSTSGRSENVRRGLEAAEKNGAITFALTGEAGLDGDYARHVLRVPSTATAAIQEVHLMILHIWCEYIEAALGAVVEGEKSK